MPTERFKSAEAYRKWNAYRHMHGIPAPHLKTAIVAGKPHTVQHSTHNATQSEPKPNKSSFGGKVLSHNEND